MGILILLASATLLPAAPAPASRPLGLEDAAALKAVADPRLSPDGRWAAYTVTVSDVARDATNSDLYMAALAGGEPLRLTSDEEDDSAPRFSPDGRWLAFLSERDGAEDEAQVWLLDRRGGDAVRLTDFEGGVSDLAWAPDARHLALVVADADPDAEDDDEDADEKPAKPVVIRRLQFKRDGEGYLREQRTHVHVFDVAARTSVQVTAGPYDDSEPVWSPDGRWIAFTSNRTADPDANQNTDVFLVPAQGGEPRRLTTSPGADAGPTFSPDGRLVAYLAGGPPEDIWYSTNHVAVVPVAGGPARPLTAALDRNVYDPRFTSDGRHLLFRLEDGGNFLLARVPAEGGPVERLHGGDDRYVAGFDVGRGGELVILASAPRHPPEVFALEGGAWRPLSRANDAFLAGIALGPVERLRVRGADGTMIDAFLTRPPGARPGQRLPTILRVHGGPVDQYAMEWELDWQMLAAHGYAVVAANPRGSSGHGAAFSRAIWADWGNKDYDDVMAAVDHVIAMGVADAERLGVGGWSYGGILTNYVITKTGRFKAAVSGASEVNFLANYGVDHYQHEWEAELGLPWRNTEAWVRLSPWFQVEKVTTPTLFLCGSEDWNVPLINSEQFYQALRRLGRETELVVYPGQAHELEAPSHLRDRWERSIAWYDRHLGVARAAEAAEATSLLGRPLVPPALDPARRTQLEANLAQAAADFVKSPDDADAIIWLGRRTAYLGRFREAIAIYTRGIARHPGDPRLLRHRGHRYISLRRFDEAIADLSRAARLIEEKRLPDAVEPDGDPNPRGIPTSTSHFNVYYHLGLAHYLKGDFERALAAYRKGMEYSRDSPDRLVATSDWMYMTLRRLGRDREAAALLAPIRADLAVIEDEAYLRRLLMYKGERTPEELLGAGTDGVALATYGYGVANWYLVNGQPEKARALFEKVVAGPQWAAFGFIASEAELARRSR
jgi:dipeptidyl aminopeptidase/acylaminoacyl peptidase/tetratricopeptide (TPR) repeat protein